MKAHVVLPRTRKTSRSTQSKRRSVARKDAAPRIQIRNVLVPIDFSAPSLEALSFAAPWVRSFGANLHLVHVSAPDAPLAGLAAMPIVLSEAASSGRLRTDMERAVKSSSAAIQEAKIHVLRGAPYEQICGLARDLKIDLIVIATRGQTGVKHMLLGSTAERVVRYSPCPVLVVRSRHNKRGALGNGKAAELSFKKILVPVDFSTCANKGVTAALDLAKQFGSTVLLMHSVHLDYYVASDEYARYDFPQLLQQTEKVAQQRLQEIARTLRCDGFEVEEQLTLGHPGQHIVDRAQKPDVDLIVTSTHGHTGFKHVFLGSTAEYVVQHAQCPVFVVPSHERPVFTSTKHKP